MTLVFVIVRPKSQVECGSKDKSQSLSPWPPRKKNVSYCECCLQSFANLAEVTDSFPTRRRDALRLE